MTMTAIKKIISFIFLFCILILPTITYFYASSVKTQVVYCKHIAYKINHIGLKCFKCITIKEEENLTFHFMLKDQELYSENCDLGIEDIVCAKKYIEEYMKNNSNNPMNEKKICLSFSTFAGDGMSVYNYDYMTDIKKDNYNKFSYYKNIEVNNFSALSCIVDPYMLDVIVQENIDNFVFLSSWTNLFYMNIYIGNMSQYKKQSIANLIPKCKIIYHCRNAD